MSGSPKGGTNTLEILISPPKKFIKFICHFISFKMRLSMPFCPACGKSIDPDKRFCVHCGAPLAPAPAPASQAAAPAASQPAYAQQPAPAQKKDTAIAAIASFLFPGLGQVYNGGFVRGLCFFFGTIIGYLFFAIPGIIIWIYGIYDAYKTANAMNKGEIPFVPHSTNHIIAFILIGIVALIIYYIVLTALVAMLIGSVVSSGNFGPDFSSFTPP